jgi:hypothetical protein
MYALSSYLSELPNAKNSHLKTNQEKSWIMKSVEMWNYFL